MDFKSLTAVLPTLLDAGISVELISPPGRGKSEFVAQLRSFLSARDGFEWGLTTLFLATYTPADMMGYLVPKHLESGELVSEFTKPAWMVTPEGKCINEYKRGIVFLDEYGQGEGDTKRVSAELLLNKKVGPHKLHHGIGVIAASNRSSDRSGVTKSFDFVINRRVQIEISDSVESWTDWALKNGISPLITSFVNQYPHIVFTDGVPDKQGPWCTPRTIVMSDRFLQHAKKDSEYPTDPVANEVVAGLIGSGAAAQLFAHMRLEAELPKLEEILARPNKVKVPTKSDAQMLACYNLAARAKKDTLEPIVTYIERFPKEFASTFVIAACKRDPKLVLSPVLEKWAHANSTLMATILKCA